MIRRTACLIALGGEPYRNLAIEKHLMDTLPEDTAILYLWQNDRCISIGRCQNPLYECRVDPFLSAGGHIARRLSGGGAVYQDRGALNFSFILPKTAFDIRSAFWGWRPVRSGFSRGPWAGATCLQRAAASASTHISRLVRRRCITARCMWIPLWTKWHSFCQQEAEILPPPILRTRRHIRSTCAR